MPSSPLSRLKRTLDLYTYQAADEIMAAFQMAHFLPVNRDPDLDIPQLARADAADEHAARRSDLVKAYPEWRRNLVGTMELRVADMVLVDEMSLTKVDADQCWRKGTAREHLNIALRHFAALRGNCPRGARVAWTYR